MANQNEIKFEQPSQLLLMVNQNLWAILGAIMLIIFAFGYFFVIAPKIKSIGENKTTFAELNSKKAAAEYLAKDIESLTKSFANLEAGRSQDLKKLHAILPQGEQLAELFVLAEKLATRRGFVLESINVTGLDKEKKEAKPVDTADQKNTESSETIDNSLKALSVSMVVSAPSANVDPYVNFKSYLDDLESSVRLLDVESVSFVSGEESLTMNFTLKTYFVPSSQPIIENK